MEPTFRAGDILFGVFYPRHYIVAVFDDRDSARAAQSALASDPAVDNAGRLWSGEEALAYHAEYIEDRATLINRLSRILAREEAEMAAKYLEYARHGKAFLTVHVEEERTINAAHNILARHGGYAMRYYGDWTVLDLAARAAHE